MAPARREWLTARCGRITDQETDQVADIGAREDSGQTLSLQDTRFKDDFNKRIEVAPLV